MVDSEVSYNKTSNDVGAKGWNISLHTPIVILAVLICAINIPIIILYYKIRSLRHSSGNTFLVGLAIADILCACVMVPAALTCDTLSFSHPNHLDVCVFYWICSITITLASVYHIVAATISKYLAIVHPMRNITACTPERLKAVIACIWVVSFSIAHILIYIRHMPSHELHVARHRHAIFLVVFAFVVPACILTIIHAHMYLRLLSNSRSRGLITDASFRSENNRRVALIFLFMFLFFVISWLPWYLLWAEIIKENLSVHEMVLFIRFLAPVLNPIVFTFVKRDYRKAALSLLSRMRGKRKFEKQRSCHTQATSSLDQNASCLDTPNLDGVPRCDPQEESNQNEPHTSLM